MAQGYTSQHLIARGRQRNGRQCHRARAIPLLPARTGINRAEMRYRPIQLSHALRIDHRHRFSVAKSPAASSCRVARYHARRSVARSNSPSRIAKPAYPNARIDGNAGSRRGSSRNLSLSISQPPAWRRTQCDSFGSTPRSRVRARADTRQETEHGLDPLPLRDRSTARARLRAHVSVRCR